MATVRYTVTATAWLELGDGPLLIEAERGHDLHLHFGPTAPALSSTDYHKLYGPDQFSYHKTEKCWGIAHSDTAEVVVS